MTTLEEVFLSISKQHSNETFDTLHTENLSTIELADSFNQLSSIQNQPKFPYQFKALFLKRWRYTFHDLKGLTLEILVPILLILFGILLTKSAFIPDPVPLTITKNFWGKPDQVFYNPNLPDGSQLPKDFVKTFDRSGTTLIPIKVNDITDLDKAMYSQAGKKDWNKYSIFFEDFNQDLNNYGYLILADTRA